MRNNDKMTVQGGWAKWIDSVYCIVCMEDYGTILQTRGQKWCTLNCVGKRKRGYSIMPYPLKSLERETGFEPATSTLARLHSTTELFPLSKC